MGLRRLKPLTCLTLGNMICRPVSQADGGFLCITGGGVYANLIVRKTLTQSAILHPQSVDVLIKIQSADSSYVGSASRAERSNRNPADRSGKSRYTNMSK